MATEFVAKGGLSTPHAIIGGDNSPAIEFKSTQSDFTVKNTTEYGGRVLDFRVSDTTGARELYTSGLSGMVASVEGTNVAVLVAQENKILWSTDAGNTFKTFNVPTGIGSWSDIIFYKGRYFISGDRSVRSSTDLITWTAPSFPGLVGTHAAWKMTVVNGVLVIPFDTNYVFRSTDGLTFAGVQKPNVSQYMHIYDLIWDGAKYVSVGNNNNPAAVYTSTDLVTWSQNGLQPNGAPECMAIGYTTTNRTYWVLNRDETFWSCTTLGTWTRVSAVPQAPAQRAGSFAVYANTSTVLVGFSDGTLYYTFDAGVKWKKLLVSSQGVQRITRSGDKFLVTAGTKLYEVTISDIDPSILQVSIAGVTTNQPQPNIPNSLVRKDYVDDKIGNDLKFQTDRLDTKDAVLEKAIADINGTTFDYGEY